MIVECNNCQTRFQLDEARIPPQGTRVRCSRCKEAFFLQHPSASRSEVTDELARQAASEGSVPPPGSTQDLPVESQVTSAGAASTKTSPGLPTGVGQASFSGSEFEEVEESDWEFIDDLPAGGGGGGGIEAGLGAAAAESSAADASEEEAPSIDVGSSFRAEDFDERAREEESAEVGAGGSEVPSRKARARRARAEPDAKEGRESDASESVFGSVDDFSSLMEEDPEASGPAPRASAPEAPAAKPTSGGELGEPEDWDFFSDDALEESGRAGVSGTPVRVAAVRVSRFESDSAVGPSLDAYPGSEGDLVRPPVDGPFHRVGRAVGWAVTLGLLGLGLARGLAPWLQPGTGVRTAVDLGGFRAERVHGHWMETARGGVLYVVTGLLRNTTNRAAPPAGELAVRLQGRGGELLDVPAAAGGVPVTQAELRELPVGKLATLQSHAARALSLAPVEPGDAAPFLAWFDGVPDEAALFVLRLRDAVALPTGTSAQPFTQRAGALLPSRQAASSAGEGDETQ